MEAACLLGSAAGLPQVTGALAYASDDDFVADGPVFEVIAAPRNNQNIRTALHAATLASDLAAITLAFSLACLIRFGSALAPALRHELLLVLPLFALISVRNEAHSPVTLVDTKQAIKRALKSLGVVMLAVIAEAYCFQVSRQLPRLSFGLGFLLSTGLLGLSRLAMTSLGRRLLGRTAVSEVVIRDGSDPLPIELDSIPVIDAARAGFCPLNRSPEMLHRLGRAVGNYDRIIVACGADRRYDWSLALKGTGANVELLTPELTALGMVGASDYRGITTAIVSLDALSLHDRVAKRAFDLLFVAVLLPFVLPTAAVIAAILKLTSPGPVFFVQERVGWRNQLFAMIKFRSMHVEQTDEAGAQSAIPDDSRITPFGRFLRKTSLDELPQLYNVLKGDMSIVGPRPHALGSRAADRLFWDIHDAYFSRHAVKPGLTGLAQVRGFRGATLTPSELLNRLQADLEYLSDWSIWRDLTIVARTARVVIHEKAF